MKIINDQMIIFLCLSLSPKESYFGERKPSIIPYFELGLSIIRQHRIGIRWRIKIHRSVT